MCVLVGGDGRGRGLRLRSGHQSGMAHPLREDGGGSFEGSGSLSLRTGPCDHRYHLSFCKGKCKLINIPYNSNGQFCLDFNRRTLVHTGSFLLYIEMDAVRYGSVSGDGDTRAREGRLCHYQLGLTQHLQRTNTVSRGWYPHLQCNIHGVLRVIRTPTRETCVTINLG